MTTRGCHVVGGQTFFQGSAASGRTGPEVVGHADLALTRAVIQYRPHQILGSAQELPADIGVALVVEGRYAASAAALDLGSARVRELDLSGELVVLGWVSPQLVVQVQEVLERTHSDSQRLRALGPVCFGLALRVLDDLGFTPITRASHMRIGYIDICRDLDGDGDGQVRVDAGREGVVQVAFDADQNLLAFAPSTSGAHPAFCDALQKAFGGLNLRRRLPHSTSPWKYQVRLPLPDSLSEARGVLERIRVGLTHLLAHFEPQRCRTLREQIKTFGKRDTLGRLADPEDPRRWETVSPPTLTGRELVH